jgi:uncharacterized protein (TIGR00251 family)
MIPSWLTQSTSGDHLLRLHVQPGAGKTGIAGTHGDALKIRLAAPPVDGKANDCLIDFIALKLGLPRACIELVSGAASRRKRLRVSGASAELIERILSVADQRPIS